MEELRTGFGRSTLAIVGGLLLIPVAAVLAGRLDAPLPAIVLVLAFPAAVFLVYTGARRAMQHRTARTLTAEEIEDYAEPPSGPAAQSSRAVPPR